MTGTTTSRATLAELEQRAAARREGPRTGVMP